VLIVGGGFSGLLLASMLGDGAVVFEEHERVGRPEHCAGVVSIRTAKLIGIPQSLIEEKFYEMKIFTKGGMLIWRGNPLAVKVDRVGLEDYLYNECLSSGTLVKLKSRVTRVSEDGFILTRDEKVEGEVVVLAEGAKRFFSRKLKMIQFSDDYYGLQARIKADVQVNSIEVYLDRLAEGFFAWLIPLKDRREAIIGLAAKSSAALRLRLLTFKKILEKRGKIRCSDVKYYFGGTVIRGVVGKVASGKVVGIGDCVQMTKPFSGGGLYPSTLAAIIMAEKLKKLINGELDWRSAISQYRTTMSPLIRGLRASYLAFKLVGLRDYLTIKIMAKGARKLGLQDNVLSSIDYDEHFKSMLHSALNPVKVLQYAGTLLMGLI